MLETAPTTKAGQHFAVTDLGSFSAVSQLVFDTPAAPLKLEGKVFLKQLLTLTSCEISCNNLPARKSIPFYHKHHLNEEIYIFVRGQGEFQVDGVVFPVGEATVVRVDPDGERCIRNISETEDLCWIVVQSRSGSHPDQAIEDGYGVEKRVSWVGKQRIS